MPLALFVLAGLQAQTLRVRPVLGERTSYRMTLTIEVAGNDSDRDVSDRGKVDVSYLFGDRVLRVDGETIHLRRYVKFEYAKGDSEEARSLAESFPKIVGESLFEIDRRNRLVVPGKTTLPMALDVAFPEDPVIPGASWEEPSQNEGDGAADRVRYTFRGIASVAGRRVALIGVTGTDPKTTMRIMPDSVFAFDLADGRGLRSRLYFEMTQEGADIDMRLEIARDNAPEWSTILAAFPPLPTSAPIAPDR